MTRHCIYKIGLFLVAALLLMSTLCLAAPQGQFDVIQDSTAVIDKDGKIVKPGFFSSATHQRVQSIVTEILQETPEYGFHFVMVPPNLSKDFLELRNTIFTNFLNADTRTTYVFLIYRSADHEYQFVIDPDLKEKVSPALLTHIVETSMVPKFKEKKYDEAVSTNIPRLAAYFALAKRLRLGGNQQSAMAGEIKVNPEHFKYGKPVFEQIPGPTKPQTAPSSNRTRYMWLAVAVGIIVLVVGFIFWLRKRNKNKEADEYVDHFQDDDHR